MDDLNDKVTGNTLTAVEWNQVPSEIQNVIENTGQVLSGADLNQLGKGIADYAANGSFYTDGGAADAYVLTQIGLKQAPTAYTDGMTAEFLAGNDNTGASTVNVAGLGIKNIVNTTIAGTIVAGVRYILKYRIGSGDFEILGAPYVSGELTITSGGSLGLTHNLGVAPRYANCELICKIAEHGFLVGDNVLITNFATDSASSNGINIYLRATSVFARFGSSATTFIALNNTTGAIAILTNANWKLIVRAWL